MDLAYDTESTSEITSTAHVTLEFPGNVKHRIVGYVVV